MNTGIALFSLMISAMTGWPSTANAQPELFLPKPATPSEWSRSGEKWTALFQSSSKTTSAGKFETKPVLSKIYIDSKDGVIKLGAQNSPDPVLFIDGVAIKTGPVDTASGLKFGTAIDLSDTTPIQFEFRGKPWALARKTLGFVRSNTDSTDVNTKYTLNSGNVTHDLGELECRISIRQNSKTCSEKVVLHFVGDIDRDGIPDLYLQTQSSGDSLAFWISSTKTFVKPQTVGKTDLVYKAQVRKTGKDLGLTEKIPALLIPLQISPAQKSVFSFDQYYGFIDENGKSKLISTSIWVACPGSVKADGTCDESTMITAAKTSEAKFLVRGIGGLKAGDLESAKISELPADTTRDDAFPSFEIEWKNSKYKLSGSQGVFSLENSVRNSVFPVKLKDPDQKPKLIWAGDLNHDGKLDLYFEVKEDDSINHLLFISPESATGPIAGPTTQFCTGPCF